MITVKVSKPGVLILTMMVPLFLGSCVVSKKKYEELEYAKRRSDAKVRVLSKENKKQESQISGLNSRLDKTLAEYNEIKNSMAESNAMKTSEIDALSSELMGLASDTTQLKERLVETLDKYMMAKEKISKNLALISTLEGRINSLVADSSVMAKDLKEIKINVDWEKKKMESEKSKTLTQVKQKQAQIETLKKELEVYHGKAQWLRKVNTKNEEEIERLSNQLKLYKNELDKALKK